MVPTALSGRELKNKPGPPLMEVGTSERGDKPTAPCAAHGGLLGVGEEPGHRQAGLGSNLALLFTVWDRYVTSGKPPSTPGGRFCSCKVSR